jgi:hypothetical protein
MIRTIAITIFAATTALTAGSLVVTQPANAQIDVIINPQTQQTPPRSGPYGDRDRDGIPNRYDNYNNQAQVPNRRDQDRDGIPNRYDRDRDGDGVPNQWDRAPANPNWR